MFLLFYFPLTDGNNIRTTILIIVTVIICETTISIEERRKGWTKAAATEKYKTVALADIAA